MVDKISNRDWSANSIESAPARNLARYEALTGVRREDFQGATILDLGSSKERLFADELKVNGIECKVISLSPDFSSEQHSPVSKDGKSVAAIAQELPFPNESFDYILDIGGPGVHASRPDQIKTWIHEVVRVLKSQGKFVTITSKLNMVIFMQINKVLSGEGNTAYCENLPLQEPQELLREIVIKRSS